MPAPVPANATFLSNYPEFVSAEAALITAKLTEAAHRTNPDVFQDTTKAEYAVMLRAAVLLTKSPFARKMRLEAVEQMIVWERELRDLQRSATMGLRVF